MENKRKESFGIIDFIKEPEVKLCFFVVCLLLAVFVMACIHVSDIAYQQKKLMIAVLGTCTITGCVVVLLIIGNLCCESGGTRRDNRDCNSRYYFTRRKDPSYPESYYRHFGELWRFFLDRHPEYSHTYVEDLDERGKRAFSEIRKYYYNLHPFERRNWSQGGSIGASGLA